MTDPTYQGPPPPTQTPPGRAVGFCLYGSGEIATGGNSCAIKANAGRRGEGAGNLEG
nr:MAG TPA: hypothetical protein [Caudoviricetes sp.]